MSELTVIEKRRVAVVTGDGQIELIEEQIPPLQPGSVLVEVYNSLVSPGTELGGWAQLCYRREHSQPAASPKPFGYSNAGVIQAVGKTVKGLKPGQRVACIGAGYAQHCSFAVVPQNLCVAIPDRVSFVQASYAMLAATGLHAVRRLEPQLGEYVSVLGLGLVGQLAAQLLKLSGASVIGWDTLAARTAIAGQWGIDATVTLDQEDAIDRTDQFTHQRGLDASVFAFGGDGEKAYKQTLRCLKSSPDGHRMGRIVIVGGSRFPLQWDALNVDIRFAARTGPGYHDDRWEHGQDYPPVFMRWTTQTNLDLCMHLIAEGRLNVDVLTTHIVRLDEVKQRVNDMLTSSEEILGVVFDMKG